jgi:hypothetical protein
MLNEMMKGCEWDSFDSSQGPPTSSEQSPELSASIKDWRFLEQLSKYQRLKKDCTL